MGSTVADSSAVLGTSDSPSCSVVAGPMELPRKSTSSEGIADSEVFPTLDPVMDMISAVGVIRSGRPIRDRILIENENSRLQTEINSLRQKVMHEQFHLRRAETRHRPLFFAKKCEGDARNLSPAAM